MKPRALKRVEPSPRDNNVLMKTNASVRDPLRHAHA